MQKMGVRNLGTEKFAKTYWRRINSSIDLGFTPNNSYVVVHVVDIAEKYNIPCVFGNKYSSLLLLCEYCPKIILLHVLCIIKIVK